MKKLLAVVLVLMLFAVALAEGIDWASMTDEEITAIVEAGQAELKSRASAEQTEGNTYQYSDVEVTILGFENGDIDGQKVLKVLLDWTNVGDEPTSLAFSGLILKAYQNGKQSESVYDSDSGHFDEYMAGYGGSAYYAFENLDDSEITIYMKDMFDSDMDDVILTVKPSEL